MENYQQSSNGSRKFLNQTEWKKCCDEDDLETTTRPQGCLSDWKQKLNGALEEKEREAACYDKANKVFTQAAAWEAQLITWKEDAEKTHEIALEVYRELCSFIEALDRVKTVETAEAAEAVLCLTKSIFDEVNELLRVSNSAEEPKGMIQQLKEWIECDESLDASKKEKALTCVAEFEKQMTDVSAAEIALLTNLLGVLNKANTLVAVVDMPDVEENLGIKWQTTDLRNRIIGESTYAERKQVCEKNDEVVVESSCNDSAVNPPEPSPQEVLLPIRKMSEVTGSCDSFYYAGIVSLYEQAEEAKQSAEKEKSDRQAKRDSAEAYYNGLKDAIEASEAAQPAK